MSIYSMCYESKILGYYLIGIFRSVKNNPMLMPAKIPGLSALVSLCLPPF
ncbi:hypothetical protein HMPREF0322_04105 [Desulfitobacterium hafniense DP7]|uniref:Uncharacterized protein n=1 Tax=Desulfitobacterium hafniense DP7 TaxID=537010 RepID=G9XSZ9_DESHA|nr:hypothetical protein HMPREF0322_04105 [Desulfitobacterium hafniense DP7]